MDNQTTHLKANWQAPQTIHALSTTQALSPEQLKAYFKLPSEPVWLNQIHSNICIRITHNTPESVEADASVTNSPARVLVVKTADCLPILLCNQAGTEIAAIHAGWRGLLGGVIENTLKTLQTPSSELIAWFGPAICANCFEVGPEVPDAFIKKYPYVASAFKPHGEIKSLGSLTQIAAHILNKQGVDNIYSSDACTFEEKNTFYSYRREKQTGRIATLIWFENT